MDGSNATEDSEQQARSHVIISADDLRLGPGGALSTALHQTSIPLPAVCPNSLLVPCTPCEE
jgi:hypothetical protein